MTLQIQNIYYDHSQESRIYERGVYSIDSITKRIHVHDGVTPNGIGTPITADLEQFATKSLSNVTQEDITNMLTNFGAMNMNSASPITDAQRNNVYGKLYMNGLQSGNNFPSSNFVRMNSSNRQMTVADTSVMPFYFPCLDTTQTAYTRGTNVDYTPNRHCCVVLSCNGGNNNNFGAFYIGGVQVFGIGISGDRQAGGNITQQFFVASGVTYKATGNVSSLVEYGIKKLSF